MLLSFHALIILILTSTPTTAFFPGDEGISLGLLRTLSDLSSIIGDDGATSSSVLRDDLLRIIGVNPGGHLDDSVRDAFASKLREYRDAEGSDPSDVVFAIGRAVFGVELDDESSGSESSSPPPADTDDEDLPIVDFDYMKGFMKEVFLSYGVTPDRAEICAEVLIEADKRGIDSHGLGRLKPIYCDRMDKGILLPDAPIEVVAECEATALVDGNLGIGLYIGPHCMQMAIDKAKKYGVGFVACRNSTVSLNIVLAGVLCERSFSAPTDIIFTSRAILFRRLLHSIMASPVIMPPWLPTRVGTCRRLAIETANGRSLRAFSPDSVLSLLTSQTMRSPLRLSKYIHFSIGLTGTNARPSIAPTFGTEPMMGTNPLTFGIPSSDPFPFVIDCATSVNQRGKIEKYAREGVKTPQGMVIDDMGVERTDTEGILVDMELGKCALTPLGGAGDKMGGYKGYGWAATVEILCTAIQCGPWGEDICGVDRSTGKPKAMPLGHFFLAIDIEKLCPLGLFKKNVGGFLQALRDSRKDPTGPGR